MNGAALLTVSVRPMKWKKSGDSWAAYPFSQVRHGQRFCTYSITKEDVLDEQGGHVFVLRGLCKGEFNTLAPAKAAAQKDFAARIREQIVIKQGVMG